MMAHLFASGAEFNRREMEQCTFTARAPTFNTSNVRNGTYCYLFDTDAGSANCYAEWTLPAVIGDTYYAQASFRVAALPGSDTYLLRLWNAAFTVNYLTIVLASSGAVRMIDRGGTQRGDTVTVVTGEYFTVEVSARLLTSGGTIDIEGRVNGQVLGTNSEAASGVTTAPGIADIGIGLSPSANYQVRGDDIVLWDSSGTGLTTWLGPAVAVLTAFPTSDNARGTAWLAGAGGTTNLWDAADNKPPAGVEAALMTNTSQVKHTGGAAQDYDANMTTLATLCACDVEILTAELIAVHGENAGSGVKTLAFVGVSNPAITTTGNVTAGTLAISTYPTSWTTTRAIRVGPFTHTRTTSAVMRASRIDTAGTAISVCLMAIQYVARLAGLPPGNRQLPQLLAR